MDSAAEFSITWRSFVKLQKLVPFAVVSLEVPVFCVMICAGRNQKQACKKQIIITSEFEFMETNRAAGVGLPNEHHQIGEIQAGRKTMLLQNETRIKTQEGPTLNTDNVRIR